MRTARDGWDIRSAYTFSFPIILCYKLWTASFLLTFGGTHPPITCLYLSLLCALSKIRDAITINFHILKLIVIVLEWDNSWCTKQQSWKHFTFNFKIRTEKKIILSTNAYLLIILVLFIFGDNPIYIAFTVKIWFLLPSFVFFFSFLLILHLSLIYIYIYIHGREKKSMSKGMFDLSLATKDLLFFYFLEAQHAKERNYFIFLYIISFFLHFVS